ncbi:hypothetical protein VTI28DRAFT_6661 [Corynascus sepedonium]
MLESARTTAPSTKRSSPSWSRAAWSERRGVAAPSKAKSYIIARGLAARPSTKRSGVWSNGICGYFTAV